MDPFLPFTPLAPYVKHTIDSIRYASKSKKKNFFPRKWDDSLNTKLAHSKTSLVYSSGLGSSMENIGFYGNIVGL